MLRKPSAQAVALLTVALIAAAPSISLAGKEKAPGGGCKGRCDTRPPVVSIAQPATGAALAGTASVTGSASDNGEIIAVELKVDGGSPQQATGSAAWSAELDTTAYANGSHVITATATDAAGNAGAASVEVTVENESAPPLPPPPPPSDPPPPSGAAPVQPPPLTPGTIGGYVFQETDRDGIYETAEQPLANRHLFLFDGAGTYLGNTYSSTSGWYQFSGLPDGAYRVEFAPADWWEVRKDWAPDTTPSLKPERSVHLIGSQRTDFGWRPIVRSSDASSPISSYVGPSGLKVKSYDDVVAARTVHDRLLEGSLIGAEASRITVRFDFADTGSTSTMAARSNGGPYDTFEATSDISYLSWLDGDSELFHEYGHAWSLYHAYIVQQDPSMSAYLAARGLADDPRVNSSYAWNVREVIAEDYRQLFGTPSARGAAQMNRELPPAGAVTGLRDFLRTIFTAAPSP